jgi:hypothetical protein
VHPVTGAVPVVYSLDFQVWRPSPTVDDSTGTATVWWETTGSPLFLSILQRLYITKSYNIATIKYEYFNA